MVTADGHVYEVGDTRPGVHDPVDLEAVRVRDGARGPGPRRGAPSGSASSRRANPFNSIVVDDRNRPFNPMVNAGAIVATGLIERPRRRRPHGRASSTRSRGTRAAPWSSTRRCTGRRASTGDRNRAIAYLMRSFGMLDGDVDAVIDAYFRQCSLARDVSRPRHDGGDARQPRDEPDHRRARARAALRRERAQRDEHLRDVRLRRRVGLHRRSPGEERRRRRRRRGAARPARDRRVLAAARRAGQQRARHQGVPAPGRRLRPPPAAVPARGPRRRAPQLPLQPDPFEPGAHARGVRRARRRTPTRSSCSSSRATCSSARPSGCSAASSTTSPGSTRSCSTASASATSTAPRISMLSSLRGRARRRRLRAGGGRRTDRRARGRRGRARSPTPTPRSSGVRTASSPGSARRRSRCPRISGSRSCSAG